LGSIMSAAGTHHSRQPQLDAARAAISAHPLGLVSNAELARHVSRVTGVSVEAVKNNLRKFAKELDLEAVYSDGVPGARTVSFKLAPGEADPSVPHRTLASPRGDATGY
jgi:hypothetical protein